MADPLQQSFCTDILQRFPHTLVREQAGAQLSLRLYRLDLATPLPPAPR